MNKDRRRAAGRISYFKPGPVVVILVPFGIFMVLVFLWAIRDIAPPYLSGEIAPIDAVVSMVWFIGRVGAFALPVFALIYGRKKIWDWLTDRDYYDAMAQAKAEGEAIGKAIGEAKWNAYFDRKRAAFERGEDFDEPPPYFDYAGMDPERRNAVAKAHVEAYKIGKADGKAIADAEWNAYLGRQQAAFGRGEGFDEPPPYDGNIDRD